VTDDGNPMDNALWDGTYIYFGSGNGTSTNNYAISTDVAAHEFTHGVVNSTSNLEYSFESGALNESYADFFGVLIDGEDDWILGEDIYIGNRFIRSMSNPSLTGQPASMSEFRELPNTKDGDNGGVHINSCIPNRALYLLAEGLSEEGLGQSIGRDKAGQIAYQTMITLPSTANFEEAAEATVEQAGILYGAAEEQSVYEAFQAVGLSASAEPPVPPKAPSPGSTNIVLATYPSESFNYLLYQVYDSNFAGFNSSLFFQVNSKSAALKRPGVATNVNGDAAGIYFTEDNDVVYVDTVSLTESVLLEQSSIQSVAFAQNLTKFSSVSETGNAINVCSLTDNSPCEVFRIRGPDYTTDQTGGTPAARIDAMDWDPTGRMLAFDYAMSVGIPGEYSARYHWSIGIVNTETGSVSYPFGKQSAEYDIGFPSFSNLTDRYIAFDLVQYTAEAENGIGNSGVFILDTQEMDLTVGALPDAGKFSGPNGTVFGMASFTADDSGLVHLYHPDGEKPAIVFVELDNYQLSGNPRYMDPYISNYPISVPRYHRSLDLSLTLSPTTLDFEAVSPNSISNKKICITNEGSARITVSPAESNNLAVTTKLGGAVLVGGQKVCGEVVVNTAGLAAGSSFSAVINLPSDSDPLSLPVSGKVADAGSNASATTFIERFYTNILGRASDPAGLNAWLDVINTQSAAAVAQGFLSSAEFLNKNLDDSAFVDILYRTLFDREGDAGGVSVWMDQLGAGRLREMVIWDFLRSAEFTNLADSSGVTALNSVDASAYGIRAFVERFYSLVLGRQPDKGGFDNWVTSLANGSYAGGDIAKAFFLSAEYLSQNTSNDAFVNTCYRAFFGREADAGGKQGWLDALAQGQSREYVLDGFIGSAEFATLASSYGIKASRASARMEAESAHMARDAKVELRDSEQAKPIPVIPLSVLCVLSGLMALFAIRRIRTG
ncbi:MAG: DUF4214 domain-containing protein, partial [Luminiphilus sp.]|nr:DUF4214 domain-containing protein [Luminiphilus sp.]